MDLDKAKQDGIDTEVIESHKVVFQEHEFEVEGQVLKETKEIRTYTVDGAEESYRTCLVHTRWIGDAHYRVKEVTEGQEVVGHEVETSLAEEDIPSFQREWEEKWKPAVDEGMVARAQVLQAEEQEEDAGNADPAQKPAE